MKNLTLFLTLLLLAANGFAQTNTFPSAGNVGIGTNSPSQKLTIHGNSAALLIETESNPSSYFAKLVANYNASKAVQFFGASGVELWRHVYSNPQVLDLMPEGGNVGIGTATPQRLLDVYGSGTGIARISGGSLGQPARRAILELSSGDSNRAQGILTISSGEENWFYGAGYGMNGAFTVGYGPTQPEYTAQSRLFITTLGNVGIGTTNPTQKLSVNGTVRAKEVIVDSGWSDYVFDESYKLKALSETEAFIKVEKHLPGIPSAQEVAEHGVNVGAMQAKLLAKIEELTLHVIEQEKRIERLETENHRLRLLIQPPLAP